MATEQRRTISALDDRLENDARKFEFFQAVRLLQTATTEQVESGKRRVPVGHNGPLDRECVRFSAAQTLAFAGSELSSYARPKEEQSARRMKVNFMGLTGASGVLPMHYTEWVIDELRRDNSALGDFLDLFNHRLISLFYRAWEKYRRHIQLESNVDLTDPHDDFSNVVASLIGLATPATRNRMAIPDSCLLFMAGHLSQRPANAVSLQCMVSEYLGAASNVIQFQGGWLQLEPEIQTRLSSTSPNPGIAARLGQGAVVGEKVWDVQSRFRIRVGPLNYAAFEELMPDQAKLLAVSQLVRTYVGPELDFDVQLVLEADEVPWCSLNGNAQLGLNTWVRNGAFQAPVDDAVFGRLGV